MVECVPAPNPCDSITCERNRVPTPSFDYSICDCLPKVAHAIHAAPCLWWCGPNDGICPEGYVYNKLTGKCASLEENEVQLRSGRELRFESSSGVMENYPYPLLSKVVKENSTLDYLYPVFILISCFFMFLTLIVHLVLPDLRNGPFGKLMIFFLANALIN